MKCSRAGCPKEALWMPTVALWPPKADPKLPPLRTLIRLTLCEEHKDEMASKPIEATVPNFREQVKKGLGKMWMREPDWTRTRVDFVPAEQGMKPWERTENN